MVGSIGTWDFNNMICLRIDNRRESVVRRILHFSLDIVCTR